MNNRGRISNTEYLTDERKNKTVLNRDGQDEQDLREKRISNIPSCKAGSRLAGKFPISKVKIKAGISYAILISDVVK